MKRFQTILFALLSVTAFSQVTIAKNGSVSNASVILEFGTDHDKGIILPYTTGEVANPSVGTFIFDTAVNRVKFNTTAGWVDLSKQNGTSDLAPESGTSEKSQAEVIIGASTSDAKGILVLEATDKAMVLPIVNNYTDIVNPSAGMIVYVKTNQRLAVFNGSKWSFWKP